MALAAIDLPITGPMHHRAPSAIYRAAARHGVRARWIRAGAADRVF